MPSGKEPAPRRALGPQLRRLGLLVTVLWLILFGRLTYLQVIRGPAYRELSEENRIRAVRVQGPRGEIVDRYGRPIAGNRYAFNLAVIPADAGDIDKLLSLIHI